MMPFQPLILTQSWGPA